MIGMITTAFVSVCKDLKRIWALLFKSLILRTNLKRKLWMSPWNTKTELISLYSYWCKLNGELRDLFIQDGRQIYHLMMKKSLTDISEGIWLSNQWQAYRKLGFKFGLFETSQKGNKVDDLNANFLSVLYSLWWVL